MFNVGPLEMILILVAIAILLIWGPTQLPKLARSIGEAIRELKTAKNETRKEIEEVKKEIHE